MQPARWRASLALLSLVFVVACGSQLPAAGPVPTATYSPEATTAAGLVAEGDGRLALSDFAGAENAYRKALEADADFAPAYSHLAYLHLFNPETRPGALAEAQQAVDLAPEDAEAWAYLARARDWNGDFEAAREAGEQAVKLNPDNADAQSFLGEIYTDLRMYTEAETAAQRAVQNDPNNAEAHRNLGYYYNDVSRYDEALAEWQAAYDLQPQFVHRLTSIAIYYLFSQPNPATARQWVNDALALAPDDTIALQFLARLDSTIGDAEAAEASCQRVLELAPSSPDGHNCLALVYAEAGDWEAAEEARLAAIEADPEDDSGYVGLGYVYYATGQCRRAVSQFQKAIELNARSGQNHAGLALAQLCAGDTDEAVASYEKAAELEPYNGEHRISLGRVYLQQGRFTQAEREIQQAIEIDPKSDDFVIWLGRVYSAQGDNERAIEQYEQAVALNPAEGDNLSELAFAHLQIGEFEQAIDEFEQALEHYVAQGASPVEQAEAQFGLGLAYVAQEDCDNAVPALQEALRLNPNLTNVQEYLFSCRRSAGLADNPLPDALTGSSRLGKDGAVLLLNQALVLQGVQGEASFQDVNGQTVLVILYIPSVPPNDPGFAAEQGPLVYAGASALARLDLPVQNLLVVAVAPSGAELGAVQVSRDFALWWAQGLIDDQFFASLWRTTVN